MASLLDGILVLDFTHWIAGPYAALFLADMGADVIKVEPPEGAEERRMGNLERYKGNTRMHLTLNRGKKGLCVDLKSAEGKKIVYELVQKADIIIQNYAPGVAKKLGIDYESLSRINDQIIFVSSTAFGEHGPYQSRKGFDIIAHAASGIMAGYADEEGNPRGPGGSPYVDIGTAMLNALSAVAALYHRLRTGVGQKIETSLFNTGMALQANGFIKIDKLDKEMHAEMGEVLKTAHDNNLRHTQIIDRFTNLRLRNEEPGSTRNVEVPDCNHRPSDRQVFPYYRIYQTKDGYMSIAALTAKQRIWTSEALGVEDKYAHLELGNGTDETYFYQKEVMKQFEDVLGTRSTNEWIKILEDAGVPCGNVNYGVTLFDDPHAIEHNMVWELQNSISGTYKMIGNPINFTKTPIMPGKGAPTLGEDTAEVLKNILGFSDEKVAQLKAQKVVR
ncbi:MAG: CoA transferase [Desulfobacteraceae bacterium]|nr:MAG: CoA transferase [Desulfobacteraceae bacterium]